MRIFLTILLLMGSSYALFAQSDTLSLEKLDVAYYANLTLLKEKKSSILNDFDYTKTDLKNIIQLKQNKYEALTEINDTIERKRLMYEEVTDLDFFNKNFGDKSYTLEYLNKSLSDVQIYVSRMDTLKKSVGLASNLNCIFSRKVQFYVLKMNKNKIDTVKCAIIKYKKVGLRNRNLCSAEFTSFPCTKTKEISLSGIYTKNMIEVNLGNETYCQEMPLSMGKSEDDIMIFPFMLDKKYLIDD